MYETFLSVFLFQPDPCPCTPYPRPSNPDPCPSDPDPCPSNPDPCPSDPDLCPYYLLVVPVVGEALHDEVVDPVERCLLVRRVLQKKARNKIWLLFICK